ncbi:glycosyltransferase [Sphingomonas sp. RS2018]
MRHPIAAPFMGGMEAHCHLLTRGLIERGHDVTLFASGDSDPDLPIFTVMPRHYEAVLPWAHWRGTERLSEFQDRAFVTAWQAIRESGFDVVHNNAMHPAIHAWAARDHQPMVTSLHVPPFDGLSNAIQEQAGPWLLQTTTSRSHMAGWWSTPPSTASIVHNGIDTDRWTFRAEGNGRAVWAGRITPNKGTALAIRAAKEAGIALDVIGPIDCMDYFSESVAPLLDVDRVYHGHMGSDVLVDHIGAASVLIATPMWDEPFGLIAAEAMACGVPVAALDRGALSEVVGDCGALAGDEAALVEAIRRALSLPRKQCRTRVERYFSLDAMIDGYEDAYAAAVAGGSNRANTVAELA